MRRVEQGILSSFTPVTRRGRVTQLVTSGCICRKATVLGWSLAAKFFRWAPADTRLLNQSVVQEQDVYMCWCLFCVAMAMWTILNGTNHETFISMWWGQIALASLWTAVTTRLPDRQSWSVVWSPSIAGVDAPFGLSSYEATKLSPLKHSFWHVLTKKNVNC